MLQDPITSAAEVQTAVGAGWDLWYVAHRDRLPGHWELRWRNQVVRVHWDAVNRIRRNLDWWQNNIEEIEQGRCWCYRLRQAQLSLTSNNQAEARCEATTPSSAVLRGD